MQLMTEEELETLAAYLMTLKNPAHITPKPIFLKDEVQHGFMVYGYIRDAKGQPVSNMKVMARPTKDGSHGTSAMTNGTGYYEAFMHLHNADAGTTIVVTTGDKKKEFTANFDPVDKTTKRQAVVDFTL